MNFQVVRLQYKDMQTGRFDQSEEEIIKRFEQIELVLSSDNTDIGFQQFQNLEKRFEEQFHTSFPKFIRRYEKLAVDYLMKVIKNSKLTYKKNEQTSLEYSYFFKQSIKIQDTDYFPFHKTLIELNFCYFIKRLHSDVAEDYFKTNPANRFEALINSNQLCSQCIGCNSFYNQFQPIQVLRNRKDYAIEFLGNCRNLKCQNILKTTEQIDSNLDLKINLINLWEKSSQFNLLNTIIKILNKNGGFIVIGCKRIQQFRNIKKEYAYEQIYGNYMNVHLVIGERLSNSQRETFSKQLQNLVEKRIQSIQFGNNIDVSFIPIRKSPFSLGFSLQSLTFNESEIENQQLHLIIMKVHPTKPKSYTYKLTECTEIVYQQTDQYYYPEQDESEKQRQRRQFMSDIIRGQQEMSQEMLFKPLRSYFDNRKCVLFPNRS